MPRTVPISIVRRRLYDLGVDFWTVSRRVKVIDSRGEGKPVETYDPPEVTTIQEAAARRAHLVLGPDEKIVKHRWRR